MSKAAYTTQNIGHYGLGFDFYTHFTSPIRRYPDVLVHRLLQFYLDGGKNIDDELLEEACKYTTQREQLATKAERDSIKYMQVKFMADKTGLVFDGLVSGVTERGIYVELIENKCEGMVSIKTLDEDYFSFDPQKHALIGERTGIQYTLGDTVRIKVKKADLIKRQLDFDLVID
jgi:VacB/RNase II family 3'-5' exoribonuclease